MNQRRRFLAAMVFGIFISASLFHGSPADAAGTAANPDLKSILEKGLRARRPEEFAFIEVVVTKVDNGILPRETVESTFLWARKHAKNEFQYFQHGLRERAKKIGVDL